jgi:F0F1-type ATP synthase membrane subunit b/b'
MDKERESFKKQLENQRKEFENELKKQLEEQRVHYDELLKLRSAENDKGKKVVKVYRVGQNDANTYIIL